MPSAISEPKPTFSGVSKSWWMLPKPTSTGYSSAHSPFEKKHCLMSSPSAGSDDAAEARFEPRPEAQSLPPLVRAAWDLAIGVFELGSVVRRTEPPHVRYVCWIAHVVRVFLLLLCDFDFSMWVSCESHQGQKARPSRPPGGASLLVNRNDVRPRYAGPKDDDGELRNKNPPTPCLWQAP